MILSTTADGKYISDLSDRIKKSRNTQTFSIIFPYSSNVLELPSNMNKITVSSAKMKRKYPQDVEGLQASEKVDKDSCHYCETLNCITQLRHPD